MVNLLHILAIVILVVDLPGLLAESGDIKVRYKRSIGNFFRRLFGRRKTGFQGTAQAQGAYNTQGSSYFPNYAYANLNPYQTYDPSASGQYQSTYGNYASAYSPYGSLAQASAAYPSYASAPGYPSSAGTGSSMDFNSVLGQFVRSAGFGPAGDQEAAASNIQSKGDTPVFSFKKLYTFPFYLNSASQGHGGYNFQIPFMKRHIRRMAQDYVNRRQLKANQKLLAKLAKNRQMMANSNQYNQYNYDPNMLAQYLEYSSRVSEMPQVAGAESAGKTTYYVGQPLEKVDGGGQAGQLMAKSQVADVRQDSSKVQGSQGGVLNKQAQHQSVSVKTSYSAA